MRIQILRWRRDHPRSRGVYHQYSVMEARFQGSSPLARGLLRDLVGKTVNVGIIPARAGFTQMSTKMNEIMPDHPRSRGVYVKEGSVYDVNSGSSPLARGLRIVNIPNLAEIRIIPARAGFTRRATESLLLGPGSSPLARGLLLHGAHSDLDLRIIPARAGFTACRLLVRGELWDHPRSRGVYVDEKATRRNTMGIIPARAGFTKPPRPCSSNPRDHPRSRGVYCRLKPTRKSLRGSSPLARGLRPPDRRLHRPRRIIPARAGFTTRPQSGTPQRTDHPRSRGVY